MRQYEKSTPGLRELGRAIRRAREQSALSVGELAAACAVSPETVDALERGRLDPAYELLHALARRLGTRASDLIASAERPDM